MGSEFVRRRGVYSWGGGTPKTEGRPASNVTKSTGATKQPRLVAMKNPVATGTAVTSSKRPAVPLDELCTTHWGGRKIYVSLREQSYRVIPRYGAKGAVAEIRVYWNRFGSQQDAWDAALNEIIDYKESYR